MPLTPKQKNILDFIEAFEGDKGYAPSQSEVANHFGFRSLGTVQNYLVRLQRQGFLKRSWNAKRGIQLTQTDMSLPLMGKVAAGRPIEAIEGNESLDVPPSFLKGGEHFALEVHGDSMRDDGILDGDYVIIKKQRVANNGETVVALIDNEATIKRYYNRDGKIELHPANSAYRTMVIESVSDEMDFKIEGILVGVIRKY